MEFSGEIEDLPLIDLLQYLYTGKKTGTLMLSLIDEDWCVYFANGEIVYADSPSSKRLLDLLVDYNQISLEIVEKTRLIKEEHQEKKSITQLLIDMAMISEDNLKKIKLAEMKRRISRLTTHGQGEFSFKNNQLIGIPDIAFDESDLLKPEDVNTHLLFEDILGIINKNNPAGGFTKPQIKPTSETSAEESPDTILEDVDHILSENKPVSNDNEDTLEFESDSDSEEEEPLHCSPPKNQEDLLILLVSDGILKNLLREAMHGEQISVITPKTVEDGLKKAEQLIDQGILPFFLSDDCLPETRRFGPTMSEIILGQKKSLNWLSPVIVMTKSGLTEKTWNLYQSGARAILPKPLREETNKEDFLLSIKKFSAVIRSIINQVKSEQNNPPPVSTAVAKNQNAQFEAKPLQ